MKTDIKWTDDCQGKKDYDGDIVAISTRYWPSSYQQNGKCSAHCSVILSDGYRNHNGETATLADVEFEGVDHADVARQVEEWAQTQMDRVERALRAEFGGGK